MHIKEAFIYLRMQDTAAAIRFYQAAFDATELFRLVEPSGRIGHAELKLGPATLMLPDAFPEYGIHAPAPDMPTQVTIHQHVDDADAAIDRAVAAGATLVRAAANQFYGERSGTVRDPFGCCWAIGHSIGEVDVAEMQRRYTAMFFPPPVNAVRDRCPAEVGRRCPAA